MNAQTQIETNIPRHRVLAKVVHPNAGQYSEVLTPDALLFLADLERRFGPQRKILLMDRELQQARFDDGELPTQPVETVHIRNSSWEVAPCPTALSCLLYTSPSPRDRG